MTSLVACPICLGAADGLLVSGSTLGIVTLLVFTVAVLAAFGGFFLTLRRRALAAAQTTPPAASAHQEPAC